MLQALLVGTPSNALTVQGSALQENDYYYFWEMQGGFPQPDGGKPHSGSLCEFT